MIIYISKSKKVIDKTSAINLLHYPQEQIDEIMLKNFDKKIEIEEQYEDCVFSDFDEELNFSLDKYNARKQKANNLLRIAELKIKLAETDYLTMKHYEGVLSDEEYEPIKIQRQAWRDEINALEENNNTL